MDKLKWKRKGRSSVTPETLNYITALERYILAQISEAELSAAKASYLAMVEQGLECYGCGWQIPDGYSSRYCGGCGQDIIRMEIKASAKPVEQEPLYEDEGCPHHGTKHICIEQEPDVEAVRRQGQDEGFAAAVAQLRGMSANKPPANLAPETNMLADMLEQSHIARAALGATNHGK